MAWRRTLECDPSGVRHPEADKGCSDTVADGESGFCECGGFAQQAVGCEHQPFTCDFICLKYAVAVGVTATYKGQQYSPDQAAQMLAHLTANPHELDDFQRRLSPTPMKESAKAIMQDKTSEINAIAASISAKGQEAVKNVEQAIYAGEVAKRESKIKAQNMLFPEGKPIWQALEEAGRDAEQQGKQIQAEVRSIMDPYTPPPP